MNYEFKDKEWRERQGRILVGALIRLAFLIGAAITLFWLLSSRAKASELTVAWDASITPGVTNYVLYGHTNALTSTNLSTAVVRISVGTNQTATVIDLKTGIWWFAVTAMKGGVQSGPSNVLLVSVPEPPMNMRTVVLQYSATLTNSFVDALFLKLRVP